MFFMDKSIYLPDIKHLFPKKKVIQVYEKNENDKIWNACDYAVRVTKTFFKQFPQATSDKMIYYHLQRSFKYARRTGYDVSSCYHYIGTDSEVSPEDAANLIGIKVTSISPFLINEIYRMDMIIQNYSDSKEITQTSIEAVYDQKNQLFMLQDSKVMKVESNKIYQYNFEPQIVKRMMKTL